MRNDYALPRATFPFTHDSFIFRCSSADELVPSIKPFDKLRPALGLVNKPGQGTLKQHETRLPEKPSFELVAVFLGPNDPGCGAHLAGNLRITADKIREPVKHTAADILTADHALNEVKENLEHGQVGNWLEADFGWPCGLAWQYLAVAKRPEPKMATIAILTIQPTSA